MLNNLDSTINEYNEIHIEFFSHFLKQNTHLHLIFAYNVYINRKKNCDEDSIINNLIIEVDFTL